MTDPALPTRRPRRRRVAVLGGIVPLIAISRTIGLAAFPWGLMRGTAERTLAARFGRPVSIGAVVRIDRFGFTPVVAIRAVRVAQALWAGPGDFATMREARVTFRVWPLLRGRLTADDVHIDGLRLALVRTADGRTNWARPGAPDPKDHGGGAALEGLTIRDAVVSYRDAKRDRSILATVSSDPMHGVRAAGRGTIRGTPVTIAFAAPPVESARTRPWPFTAAIDGAALSIHTKGAMDRALDTNAMTLDVTARASDLALIDAVIEAGLFHSQPVVLVAHVRRDRPRWRIEELHGTIGRSDVDGDVSIDKVDGRTRLDGRIAMRQLDFDDVASDAGVSEARARDRAIGPRVVPDTRIDLRHIGATDGVVRFAVGRIISRDGASSLVSTAGTATLDHRILTLSPLTLRLPGGAVTGSLRVDQHDDRPLPLLTADLALKGSSLRALGASGNGAFTGAVTAHARLRGAGATIRSAIAASDGVIGFVVRDGSLPAEIAQALGFDAGRALLADRDDRAGLRCVVARLVVRGGVATPTRWCSTRPKARCAGRGHCISPTSDSPSA